MLQKVAEYQKKVIQDGVQHQLKPSQNTEKYIEQVETEELEKTKKAKEVWSGIKKDQQVFQEAMFAWMETNKLNQEVLKQILVMLEQNNRLVQMFLQQRQKRLKAKRNNQ